MLINEYTAVRAYPNYLLLYSIPPGKKCTTRYDVSQEARTVKNELSLTSKRKLKRALNNLIWISKEQFITHTDHKGSRKLSMKANLITLTLPARQRESDYQVKQYLNTFLTGLKFHGLTHYVWRAEKQANGNIHIHLATNCYIHWQDIRKRWNKILTKAGYLISYRREQEQWHRAGFKLRPELIKYGWSREAQFKAWRDGVNSNWSDPNTTDVHKVNKVKNLGAYLAKYMLKDDQNGSEGRLWGCSRNLLEKPQDLQITNEQMAELEPTQVELASGDIIFAPSSLLIHENDFFAIYRLPDWFQVNESLLEYKERIRGETAPLLV